MVAGAGDARVLSPRYLTFPPNTLPKVVATQCLRAQFGHEMIYLDSLNLTCRSRLCKSGSCYLFSLFAFPTTHRSHAYLGLHL